MIAQAYLEKNCTSKAFVRAVAGLYPDVRFTYRPALVEEREIVIAPNRDAKPDAIVRKTAAFVADKLAEWDVKDSKGNAVEKSAANLLRLQPALYDRFVGIVLGYLPTDIDPTWPEAVKEKEAEEQHESALTGDELAAVRERADAKN
jgi:hypothetical protein